MKNKYKNHENVNKYDVQELNGLVAKASRDLSLWGWKSALLDSLVLSVRWVAVIPLLTAVLSLSGVWEISLDLGSGLLITTTGFVLLWMISFLGKRVQWRLDKRQALSLYDSQLNLSGRLTTADEFLSKSSRDGFSLAAIEDGCRQVKYASQSRLTAPNRVEWRGTRKLWASLPVTLLILWVSTMVMIESEEAPAINSFGEPFVGVSGTKPRLTAINTDSISQAGLEEKGQAVEEYRSSNESNSKLSESSKQSQGARGSSSLSANSSMKTASAASGGKGSSGKKNSSSKTKSKQNKSKSSSGKKPTKVSTSTERAKSESSNGESSKSEKNPSTQLPSASKLNTALSRKDAEDNGEEFEDESEKKGRKSSLIGANKRMSSPSRKSSGQPSPPGKKKHKKGKRPPNRSNSKSAIKKSRGIPAMILGVPTPDLLTGTPSNSRFKVEQQQIQPVAQTVGQGKVSIHDTRKSSIGEVAQIEVSPWAKELVKDYFNVLRQQTAEQEGEKNDGNNK